MPQMGSYLLYIAIVFLTNILVNKLVLTLVFKSKMRQLKKLVSAIVILELQKHQMETEDEKEEK